MLPASLLSVVHYQLFSTLSVPDIEIRKASHCGELKRYLQSLKKLYSL